MSDSNMVVRWEHTTIFLSEVQYVTIDDRDTNTFRVAFRHRDAVQGFVFASNEQMMAVYQAISNAMQASATSIIPVNKP